MPIIGINFDKISIEKQKQAIGKVSINHNLQTTDITEEKLNISTSGDTARFKFKFTIEYSPDIGNITMIGSVLYLDDPEVIEEILSNWKKNKELPKEVMPQIFDMILAKCN